MPNESFFSSSNLHAALPWRSRSTRTALIKEVGGQRARATRNAAEGQLRVWTHVPKATSVKALGNRAYLPLVFLDQVNFPHDALARRLHELREAAGELGWHLSSTSESFFHEFIQTASVSHLPVLTLRPLGTLRAVWESASGDQIGLHFAEEGDLNYVLFSGASPEGNGRHFGTTDLENVLAIIDALRLDYLLR